MVVSIFRSKAWNSKTFEYFSWGEEISDILDGGEHHNLFERLVGCRGSICIVGDVDELCVCECKDDEKEENF